MRPQVAVLLKLLALVSLQSSVEASEESIRNNQSNNIEDNKFENSLKGTTQNSINITNTELLDTNISIVLKKYISGAEEGEVSNGINEIKDEDKQADEKGGHLKGTDESGGDGGEVGRDEIDRKTKEMGIVKEQRRNLDDGKGKVIKSSKKNVKTSTNLKQGKGKGKGKNGGEGGSRNGGGGGGKNRHGGGGKNGGGGGGKKGGGGGDRKSGGARSKKGGKVKDKERGGAKGEKDSRGKGEKGGTVKGGKRQKDESKRKVVMHEEADTEENEETEGDDQTGEDYHTPGYTNDEMDEGGEETGGFTTDEMDEGGEETGGFTPKYKHKCIRRKERHKRNVGSRGNFLFSAMTGDMKGVKKEIPLQWEEVENKEITNDEKLVEMQSVDDEEMKVTEIDKPPGIQ